jgi:hypothetical protein
MPRPVEPVVKEVLKKNNRGLLLRKSMVSAWDAMIANYPDRAWWRRKSTRAALVWEHAVNNSIAALHEDKGVFVQRHYDTVSFIIDDVVLLRLKKADIELITGNVQTLLASLFHDHRSDLFGYQGLQRVEAAYVLNRFENAMAWVGIVAREKNRHLFHFEFDELSGPIEMPLPFPEPPKTPPEDLATVRRPDEDKDKPGGKGE